MLIDYIYMERQLEMAKCSLIKKADFNLMDSFKVFDRRSLGKVSGADILQCLTEYYGYYADPARWNDQIYLLFRRHDLDMDAALDFEEFSHLLLPVTHEYASILASRPDFYMNRQEYDINNYFNLDTRHEIATFWSLLFDNEIKQELLRNEMRANHYLQQKEIFNHMDYDSDGFVSKNDFN